MSEEKTPEPVMSTADAIMPDILREIARIFTELSEEYQTKFATELATALVPRLSQLFQNVQWGVKVSDDNKTIITIEVGVWKT